MNFVALIETNEHILLLTNKDGSVRGWKTLADVLDYFEKPFKDAHARSYTMSMSACINYITFRPSIVSYTTVEDLQKKLMDDPPYQHLSVSNVSGWYQGIVCAAKAKKEFDEGAKPRLI